MDYRLAERLKAWHEQIDRLKAIHEKYLLLEASQKAMEGKAFLSSEGQNVKEKEARAHINKDLIDFKKGLALAEAEYLHQRRLLDLRHNEYLAEHVTFKIENDGIKRGMGER